jgi:RNA polymerase sporulation-specific sigma factor
MIEDYLKQLEKISILSENDERNLWYNYKEMGDYLSRQKLITSFQPLVFKIAKQYANNSDLIMDLIQEGIVGLIDAVDNYNPDIGTKFITFAVYHIRGRIIDYLKKGAKIETISLNAEKDGIILLEKMNIDKKLLEQLVEKGLLFSKVNEVLSELPEREQRLIQRIYINDEAAVQVARDMGISLSYLHRIKKKSIKRLRGKLSTLIHHWS